MASCLGRTTSLFTNCAILVAISKAIDKKHLNAMIALALASYLSLYPVLLLLPLLLLSFDQRQRGSGEAVSITIFFAECGLSFLGACVALLYMSYILTGFSWEFLASTYGNHLAVADLTPNIGLWWYFFIEMFDSFREFFLGVFWLHLGAYVGGLSIRLRRQPLFVTTTMLGIFAIFKPYPSVSDASLFLSLLPLYRHVFPRKFLFPMFSSVANIFSDEIHVFCRGSLTTCHTSWAGVLLSLDICWLRKCEFLLCHYFGMESRTNHNSGRHNLGGPEGRMGGRETRHEGQVH